jgi:hypothetical protein
MGRFGMDADELAAEIRNNANFARPDLRSALQMVLQSSLAGAGMDIILARGRASDLLTLVPPAAMGDLVLRILEG